MYGLLPEQRISEEPLQQHVGRCGPDLGRLLQGKTSVTVVQTHWWKYAEQVLLEEKKKKKKNECKNVALHSIALNLRLEPESKVPSFERMQGKQRRWTMT